MSVQDSHGDTFIGLMSGTSMDGIDAAIVRFADRSCDVIATLQFDYPDALRTQLVAASRHPDSCNVDDIGQLDQQVGVCFLHAAEQLIQQAALDRSTLRAIGSHGQTLRHRPDLQHAFTLQIGDPNIIAAGTGITTIADFRRRDIADGGQGAPLTPVFHRWLFSSDRENRVVLNLGGIANITCLPTDGGVSGFDTGPGNTLLDAWVQKHRGARFDEDGAWSASGNVHAGLLEALMCDSYFDAAAPKSTGFEYFNLGWLEQALSLDDGIDATDVQATLCELTAQTVAGAVRGCLPDAARILVCGGGAHNGDLLRRLQRALGDISVELTADHGLDPDWVEAAAFAWLAKRTLAGEVGNLPSVTGTHREAVLGGIYQ